MNNIRRW